MKQFKIYNVKNAIYFIFIILLFAFILSLFARCTKYEDRILPYYDTTFVVITDTNDINLFDTTRIIIHDTVYTYIIIYDTISTIKLGNQIWMNKDLDILKYNDGTDIKLAYDNADWSLQEPAVCYYNNDKNTYKLYNWFAVNTGKLCPIGFRIPSDSDWKQLEAFLAPGDKSGSKLKEKGYTHWKYPNADATDEYGWTAIPKFSRWGNGQFVKDDGFYIQSVPWWSSTIDNVSGLPIYRYVQYLDGALSKYRHYPNNGYSIRCIKN